MSTIVLAQVDVEGSNPVLNIAIFGVFVVITLGSWCYVSRPKPRRAAVDFYTAGGGVHRAARTASRSPATTSRPRRSSASPGAIALNGYDGFLYSIGFLVAWLVALLLVAELLRNTGKYTMGDVLAFRCASGPSAPPPPPRRSLVSFFYLLAQMAGAGGLVALLLNVTDKFGQGVVIAVVGAADDRLRAGRRHARHHLGADHQGGAADRRRAVMTVWVLALVRLQLLRRCSATPSRQPAAPVRRCSTRASSTNEPDRLHLAGSRAGARHRGPAAHPDALLHRADRQGGPPLGGLGDLADRPVLPVHAGARATARPRWSVRRRSRAHRAARTRRRRCWPTQLGGDGAAGHHLGGRVRDDPRGRRRPDDHGVGVVRPRRLRQRDQEGRGRARTRRCKVARLTAVVIGVVAIVGGILANGQNVAFLVALAFAVAASANLPTILYSLFWKRFNTAGRAVQHLRRSDHQRSC